MHCVADKNKAVDEKSWKGAFVLPTSIHHLFNYVMKKKIYLSVFVVVLLLHGCFIKSLHPFFQEKNVVFDPELVGTWMDQDSSKWNIVQMPMSKGFLQGDTVDNSYLMSFEDQKGNITWYDTHLFELEGERYLDFFPLLEEIMDDNLAINSIIPSHSLAKLMVKDHDHIKVEFFNEEWLHDLMQKNRVKIAHEKINMSKDYKPYVLTASTEELQKFIIKYHDDPNLFNSMYEARDKDQNKDEFSFYLQRVDE